MVLYQAKMFQSSWFDDLNPEVLIGRNDSGIMDPDHLTDYIRRAVIPFLKPGAKVFNFKN
jgi:hypothetical protein